METSQFQGYEVFRQSFGESGAGAIMKSIDHQMEHSMENFSKGLATKLDAMASKLDLMAVKHDLMNEVNLVRNETHLVRSELTRAIYVSGLIQFLAVIGSILAIISFMRK